MRPLARFVAAALAATALPMVVAAPAAAQAAAPAESVAASKFVDELSATAFAILKDKSLSKNQVRAKFRTLLHQNFALDDIGNRLIRRYRSQITPAQYSAYQAALPEFAINAYTDRLYDYRDADVQPVRTLPRGTKGDIDVYSRVVKPGGGQFDAIWTLRPTGDKFQILNLSIAGINLSLTQEADFSAYIAKNGFDALVAFMTSSNAKGAI